MVKLAKNAKLFLNTESTSYIETDKTGRPTAWVGKDAVNLFRLRMILNGLRLEVRTGGKMRLTAKAPKMTTIVKQEFGLKGNRESLLDQFEALMEVIGNPEHHGIRVVTQEERQGEREAALATAELVTR